jgi:hypothetical protein
MFEVSDRYRLTGVSLDRRLGYTESLGLAVINTNVIGKL